MSTIQEKRSAADAAEEFRPGSSFNHGNSSEESFDKDLAAKIVPNRAQDVDSATERKVLHKIDLHLIPWMWIGYGFVYYDKVISHKLAFSEESACLCLMH